MTESLQWHPVSERMPDLGATVLIWFVYRDGDGSWAEGWWGGHRWFDREGEIRHETVTHWAQPKGPQ
jgi:hypothetical protein